MTTTAAVSAPVVNNTNYCSLLNTTTAYCIEFCNEILSIVKIFYALITTIGTTFVAGNYNNCCSELVIAISSWWETIEIRILIGLLLYGK